MKAYNQLISDFERIVTLKTCLYYRINQNYLTLDDLLEIKEITEVELEIIKLVPIFTDDLNHMLNIWRAQVNQKFEELYKQLYNEVIE